MPTSAVSRLSSTSSPGEEHGPVFVERPALTIEGRLIALPVEMPSLGPLMSVPDDAPPEVRQRLLAEYVTGIMDWADNPALAEDERAFSLLKHITALSNNLRVSELLIGLYLDQLDTNETHLYTWLPGAHAFSSLDAAILEYGWQDIAEYARKRFKAYEKLLSWEMNASLVLGLDREHVSVVLTMLRGVDREYNRFCRDHPEIPEAERHVMLVQAAKEGLARIVQTPIGEALKRHATSGLLLSTNERIGLAEEGAAAAAEGEGAWDEEEGEGATREGRTAPRSTENSRGGSLSPDAQPLDFSGVDSSVYDAPPAPVLLEIGELRHIGRTLAGTLTLPADAGVLRALDRALSSLGLQARLTKAGSPETLYLPRLAREIEEGEF